MSHLNNAFQILAIAQEANAQPGEGLSALQTITYFLLIPTALFAVIGGLAWLGSAPKKDHASSITRIED